jgi:hypothetical protein
MILTAENTLRMHRGLIPERNEENHEARDHPLAGGPET